MTPPPYQAVTSSQTLVTPAIADLERAYPNSHPGEIVALETRHWSDKFILTARYGWLRLPD